MLDIQKNVPLAQYTTFKIGGPAREFVAVTQEDELIEALRYAKENNLRYYILGGGSNVFFDDKGFDGLVVRTEGDGKIKLLEENQLECWTGESLGNAVGFARDNDLAGLEELSGIPGQFGGAVRGNAGAFGTELKDMVMSVKALDVSEEEPKIKIFNQAECGFSYRSSLFKKNPNFIILSAILQLKNGKKDEIEQRMKEITKKRMARQPQGWYGCAGSFFENPTVENRELIDKFEKDTGVKISDNKIPAGWLIEEVGFSGKKVGGVEVSEKHANFVINTGTGSAEDIVMLVSLIKQKVRSQLGVQLKEEVNYVCYRLVC